MRNIRKVLYFSCLLGMAVLLLLPYPSRVIRYTTDGSLPNCRTSPVYSGSITVSAVSTLKAIGCIATKWHGGLLTSAHAQQPSRNLMLGLVDAPNTPTDSPGAGTYSSTQSVTLSDATAQFILYTTTGTPPACPATGTLYSGAFNISATTTLKAIGCNGVTGGGVLTSVYTISAGEPTFTEVQGNFGSIASSGTTVAVTLTSNPATGDAVACAVIGFPTSLTISSITDGNSNAYTVTPNSPSTAQGGSARIIWLAYLLNAPSNANKTITATFSGSITFASVIRCDQFHRSSGTWTFDTDVVGSGTSAPPVNTPSITPSVSGELLYAGLTIANAADVTGVGGSWTQSAGGIDSSNKFHLTEYILSAASGATAANFTLSGTANWNSMAMALK